MNGTRGARRAADEQSARGTCGFVFPVSTPPNAIVFGTGRVPLTRMIRAGALLDVACILVVWTGVLLLRPWLPRAG